MLASNNKYTVNTVYTLDLRLLTLQR